MRTRRPRNSRFIAPPFPLFPSHPFAALYLNLLDGSIFLEDFGNAGAALFGSSALQRVQSSVSLYPTESDHQAGPCSGRVVEAGLWENATQPGTDCTPSAGRKGAAHVNLCRLCREFDLCRPANS